MIRTILFVFLCLLTVAPAHARESHVYLLLDGFAHHIDSTRHWNDYNYGAGAEYRWRPHRSATPYAFAMQFEDSTSHPSWAIGFGQLWRVAGDQRAHCDAGFAAFVMHRRDAYNGDPFPGAMPAASCEWGRVGANLAYVPRLPDTRAGVVFLFFQVRI